VRSAGFLPGLWTQSRGILPLASTQSTQTQRTQGFYSNWPTSCEVLALNSHEELFFWSCFFSFAPPKNRVFVARVLRQVNPRVLLGLDDQSRGFGPTTGWTFGVQAQRNVRVQDSAPPHPTQKDPTGHRPPWQKGVARDEAGARPGTPEREAPPTTPS